MKIRITRTCFFSDISFTTTPFTTSIVRVELEVSTRPDKVDIDAESTSTTTRPISKSGNFDNINGTIPSKATLVLPSAAVTIKLSSWYSLAKPPIKYEPPATTNANTVDITVPVLIDFSSLIA